ncbi:uncharacterized protein F5891DRAFT_968617 [Suillus fuscotomentosus]|uniref:Uncharacterized protein n=1 Tax=Suillus fuscotomentosus TaxID=1912939 RepID=A0AAD4HB15_9AGAM|nr:uncharacterized protein F5891DRAFT_968617 [Suillus fuscotomentosus]KAG1886364.1 hypothetical protein F5891DRAFT_968617 [Suillus fuscotomentosus]
MRTTRAGTISPDERKVHVTQSVSSIFQFKAIDWGMESWELHVVILPMDRPTSLLYITSMPLYQLIFQHSSDWRRRLSCAMDDVLVFELGCSEDEPRGSYDIEWWQAHKETAPGQCFTTLYEIR